MGPEDAAEHLSGLLFDDQKGVRPDGSGAESLIVGCFNAQREGLHPFEGNTDQPGGIAGGDGRAAIEFPPVSQDDQMTAQQGRLVSGNAG